MTTIFISYRQADSLEVVGRLWDRLQDHYPDGTIFRDIDSLPPGRAFPDELDRALEAAQVVLVVIGPNWLNAEDSQGRRRLDNPDDFVRKEVEAALASGVPVIPILVSNAQMPKCESLPDSLKPLTARQNACVRSDPDFHRDVDRLLAKLDKHEGLASLATMLRGAEKQVRSALLTLRRETLYLWKSLEELPRDKDECAAELKRTTLEKVSEDLDLLQSLGHLRYKASFAYNQGEYEDNPTPNELAVFTVRLEGITPQLKNLIQNLPRRKDAEGTA